MLLLSCLVILKEYKQRFDLLFLKLQTIDFIYYIHRLLLVQYMYM